MKGIDIVVGGSVGHLSAFMAQAGHLVVCGDAGHSLGDSIYEAVIYVQGQVAGLGADCIEKEMTAEHLKTLSELLKRAGCQALPPLRLGAHALQLSRGPRRCVLRRRGQRARARRRERAQAKPKREHILRLHPTALHATTLAA